MSDAGVVFSQTGNIGHILLNRPKALNALDLPMVDAITAQMQTWEKDPSVGAIVIEGAGEKAFCAGGDIRGIYDARKSDNPAMLDAFYRREYQLNNYIATYPKPYIALLDGITMGGGVGLSIHGRYRVVTERTMFAMPETGIGFFPDVGGGYFLPRCPGQIGMYLGLTGARLGAADCLYAGIATHGVSSDKIDDLKQALEDADLTHASTEKVKSILEDFSQEFAPSPLAEDRAEIDRAFAGHSVTDIFDALDKAGTPFAEKTLKMLRQKSPTSICVTFEQLRQGADLSLTKVLKMEFRLAQRMVEKPDLFEGVRAVIVDKDHAPKWQYADIGQVDPRDVKEYFEPLPSDRELAL